MSFMLFLFVVMRATRHLRYSVCSNASDDTHICLLLSSGLLFRDAFQAKRLGP